jgi:type I restriction enzyme S subunit
MQQRFQPSKHIDGEFLWQWLIGQYAELRSTGALGHLSHLNLSYVRDFLIPKPPPSVQREIAEALRTIDTKSEHAQSKIQLLEELFVTLLHQLMTGHIRVHGLDVLGLESNAAA